MSAQSPRPISQRVFTVLIAVLLVGSLAAPIGAAQPAAAQSDPVQDGQCMYDAIGWWIFDCAQPVGTPVSGTGPVDLHVTSVSEWESMKSTVVSGENFVGDSQTVAFVDARNTVASEWEAGNSSSEAWQASRENIRDYYAFRQSNYLQSYQKSMAQLNYNLEVMNQDPDIADNFISGLMEGQGSHYESSSMTMTNKTTNVSVELVNGSVENISAPVMKITHRAEYGATGMASGSSELALQPFEGWQYNAQTDRFESTETTDFTMYDSDETTAHITSVSPLSLNVQNVPEADLESRRVWDTREFYELWTDIENQSSQATSEFPSSAVDDLYEGLDSGAIDPSDVRGPEGQWRYMSGDAEAQSGAYTLALYETMEIGSPDLSNVSEMKVSYTGNTTMNLAEVGGERVKNYSDPVNKTYTGILFADEAPAGGFVNGETYDASTLNGSIEMVPFEGDPVSFYDGNFTIESMTDSDGNELESADWSGPEPESYNSDDFVEYVNHTTEVRETIIRETSDDDDGGTGPIFGGIFDGGLGGGGGLIGLGIIGIVILAVVGIVTDAIPGLGN